jgi:hypothetical protein
VLRSYGGWSALDGVTAQEIRPPAASTGSHFSNRLRLSRVRSIFFDQTLLVDYSAKRMRLTFNASRTYPTPAPVSFVEVIDGNDGMLETTKERLHPSRLATRLRDYNRLPIRLIYAAKAATT